MQINSLQKKAYELDFKPVLFFILSTDFILFTNIKSKSLLNFNDKMNYHLKNQIDYEKNFMLFNRSFASTILSEFIKSLKFESVIVFTALEI